MKQASPRKSAKPHKTDQSERIKEKNLTVTDLSFARSLSKVFDLLKEYEIPTKPTGKGIREPHDLTSRLFLLVLALAETHPKHKARKKRGVKPTWGNFQKAALVSEVDQFRRLAQKTGKTFTVSSACRTIAREPYWQSFLINTEKPAEVLRQTYSISVKNESLENFILFYKEAEKKSEATRKKRIQIALKDPSENRLLRNLPMNIDQLLHR